MNDAINALAPEAKQLTTAEISDTSTLCACPAACWGLATSLAASECSGSPRLTRIDGRSLSHHFPMNSRERKL